MKNRKKIVSRKRLWRKMKPSLKALGILLLVLWAMLIIAINVPPSSQEILEENLLK